MTQAHREIWTFNVCTPTERGGSEVGKNREKKRLRPLEGGGILTRSQSRVQREIGRAVKRSGRHRESLGGGADGAQPGGMAAADSREEQSTDRERGHRSAQQKAQETGSNNSEHS